jgi:hypothetical protein
MKPFTNKKPPQHASNLGKDFRRNVRRNLLMAPNLTRLKGPQLGRTAGASDGQLLLLLHMKHISIRLGRAEDKIIRLAI